jgi:sulfate permease, SulP family
MNKFLRGIKRYIRGKLRADLTAGLTVAMVVIPQSMAYAAIAGVSPIYGLFTAVIPTIVGALFGSFPFLVTGPTNPTALVTASVLIAFANQPNYLEFVLVLAILAGLFKLILGLLKLGAITRYISNSVLVGFLSAAGVLIILGQTGNLLGISLNRHNGVWGIIVSLFQHLPEVNLRTIIISATGIGVMLIIRKLNRKLPAALITIIITSGLVVLLGWQNNGIQLISDVGLPEKIGLKFHIPQIDLSNLLQLSISGAAVALFGLMEAGSIAKAMSQMTNETIDPSREMIGQGLASLIGGFFQCMPSSGSPSRTVVNVVNGAKTRGAAIISGLGVLVFLLLFSNLIGYIPIAGLAAVVIVSSAGLINIKLIDMTWQSSIQSRVVMGITFFSTLILPLEYAIYLGILLTILIFLGESSHVNLKYLVADSDGEFYEYPLKRITRQNPNIAIINIEGDLYFAAIEDLQQKLEQVLNMNIKVLILRFRRTHLLASTGVRALDYLIRTAYGKGIQVLFCGVQNEIQTPMESAGILDILGEEKIFRSDDKIYRSTRQALKKANAILKQQKMRSTSSGSDNHG